MFKYRIDRLPVFPFTTGYFQVYSLSQGPDAANEAGLSVYSAAKPSMIYCVLTFRVILS
jgi:hypothetical protein